MESKLSEEEFRTLLKALKNTYSADWFIPTEEVAKTWYRLLMDIPYRALSLGITKFMQTSPKQPTPADIRKAAMEFIPHPEQLSEQEVCSLVRRAVRNSAYNSKEEFSKFPELIQRAVGSPETLEAWAMLEEDEFENVALSNFIKGYRTLEKRQQDFALLSPAMQQMQRLAVQQYEQARISTEKPKKVITEKKEEKKMPEMPEALKSRYEQLREKLSHPQQVNEPAKESQEVKDGKENKASNH